MNDLPLKRDFSPACSVLCISVATVDALNQHTDAVLTFMRSCCWHTAACSRIAEGVPGIAFELPKAVLRWPTALWSCGQLFCTTDDAAVGWWQYARLAVAPIEVSSYSFSNQKRAQRVHWRAVICLSGDGVTYVLPFVSAAWQISRSLQIRVPAS